MLFRELKQNLFKDFSGFPTRRLAVVGDSATQFMATAIRAFGYEERLNFEIFEADFDQLDSQLLNPRSELYCFSPEYVVLYLAAERLRARFVTLNTKARVHFADEALERIENWWQSVAAHSRAKIIHLNFVEVEDGVFGQFASKVPVSFLYQLRKINFELMNRARANKHVFIADATCLSARVGYENAHDPRLYAASKVAFSLDFLPHISKAVTDIVKAVEGRIKKCVVLDLDNTLWGGVIGDDGLENIQLGDLGMGPAFDELQKWAKELKLRGVLLAVCSKNEMDVAQLPFEKHPDMILRTEDIAIFVANWDNKADNIRRIQQTLNIGLDTMVFLDDNPFERNLVRQLLPEVSVPELPEDPSLVVPYLRSLNLFETASFSEEDSQRTRQYREEFARVDFQKSFTSVDDYLRSLKMVSVVRPFDEFSVPRVAQLTQRSNQFNLRTIRYSEADIERIRNSQKFITFEFRLEDRFGDHGLVALVILERQDAEVAFVDTWIMSCRVLKRGMEEFTVNQMVKRTKAQGIQRLVGEYIPTAKNKIVRELYPKMGFVECTGRWCLDVEKFSPLTTWIRESNDHDTSE